MKQFRTPLNVKDATNQISHSDKLFFIGSCFSENISSILHHLMFPLYSNPYGVLFNPVSIQYALEEIIQLKQYTTEDIVFYNELYHSMQHNSKFSSESESKTLSGINQQIDQSHLFLKDASYLFITLGTAWVYRYRENIVANCHKIPNTEFTKEVLQLDTVTHTLEKITSSLKAFNPQAQVVFTLSPVRHLRDGFEENTISKSILRTAIYNVQQTAKVSYFPAYEIMMDDLRDYRFYKEDMLHPNKMAIDYLFEKFSQHYFSKETQELNNRISKLNAAKNHRVFNKNTSAAIKHSTFIEREQKAIQEALKHASL